MIVCEDVDGCEIIYVYDCDGCLVSIWVFVIEYVLVLVECYCWLVDGCLVSVGGVDCEVCYMYDEVGNLCLES